MSTLTVWSDSGCSFSWIGGSQMIGGRQSGKSGAIKLRLPVSWPDAAETPSTAVNTTNSRKYARKQFRVMNIAASYKKCERFVEEHGPRLAVCSGIFAHKPVPDQ